MSTPHNFQLQTWLLAELQATLQALQPEVSRLSVQIAKHEEYLIRHTEWLDQLKGDLHYMREWMSRIHREIGQVLGRMEVADTRPGVNLNFGGDVDVGRDMQVADRGGRIYGGHQEQRGYQGWPRYPDRGSWEQDQPADAAEERRADRPPYTGYRRYR